jgi:SdpC family antimicrobial peptide
MNKQNKYKFNLLKLTVVIVILLTLVFPSTYLVSAQSSSQSYTGEEIFRGVLFGDGPVAVLFPEIWDDQKNNRNSSDWADLREQVISEIKVNDAGFMARFGTEMKSGDHIRINTILSEARTKLDSAQTASQDADSLIDGRNNGDYKVKTEVLVLDQYVAVVKFLWLWIAAVSQQDIQESTLYQESVVDLVADKLAE